MDNPTIDDFNALKIKHDDLLKATSLVSRNLVLDIAGALNEKERIALAQEALNILRKVCGESAPASEPKTPWANRREQIEGSMAAVENLYLTQNPIYREAPHGLAVAERIYTWMLSKLPLQARATADGQKSLCILRDYIAHARGASAQQVQDNFERVAYEIQRGERSL